MFSLRRALCALAIAMAVPVCAAQAATFTVDRTDDADVSNCSTAANDCTLRGAINKANASAGADTINFADNVRGTLSLAGGQLAELTGTIAINGPGANALKITNFATYSGRLFRLSANANASISGLNMTGGAVGTYDEAGGAINNSKGGTLAIANCVFTNNSANVGGAISNSGLLTITGSTLSGNGARTHGGAIYNTGTATIENSTISDNSVSGYSSSSDTRSGSGAGIYNYGKLTARNCTITGNSINTTATYNYIYGGGISSTSLGSGQILLLDSCTITNNSAPTGNGGGIIFDNSASGSTATITNCIITGNFGGDVDTRSANTSPLASSYNIVGSGNILTLFNGTGDQTGVNDAKLGPLADNGGPTQTRALLANSPAIDAGQTALATDQRGIARPQGGAADIGAYETQAAPPSETPSLIVTTLDDVTANDNQNSLREAIVYANAKAGADTITFADNVRGSIKLNGSALPTVTSEIIINGPGAPNLTLDGDGKSNLVLVSSGGNLQLNDLTLSGGFASPDGLGGAICNEGIFVAHQIVVSGNRADAGGGIVNIGGSSAIFNSTLSGNAANNGGGIFNDNGSLSLANSTVSGNSATGTNPSTGGGGIISRGDNAVVYLESVTLTGNSAMGVANNARAGVWIMGGQLRVHNSIVSGNGARDLQNDGGTIASTGYNIIGALGDSSVLVASDRVGIDPQIGALADNGGPTPTRALLPGSPAINTGDPATQDGFDQRSGNFPRVRGGIVDVGAFEVQSDEATATVTLNPQNPTTNRTLTVSLANFEDDAVYAYLWKKNGVVIAGETTARLDLSKAGNGDAGDVIRVEVSTNNFVRTASVTIANSAPIAFSRNVSAPADSDVAFELRGSDPDGDALTFKLVNAPANGTAAIRVDPTDGATKLFYRSRARYNGVEVLRFVAIDSSGAKSNAATLGIAVKYSAPPVNRAPVAGDTFVDTYVGESVVKGLLGRDPDGDALTFRIVNNAKFGKSEIRRDADGQFKLFYTGLNRFYGNDRVTYVAVDSKGKQSNVATVGINFINRAPSAQNNDLSVASGELVSQYLFATDADNDALTFRLVNNPRYGAGEIKRDEQNNWRVYYQSLPGYVGPDRITFIAIDAQGKQSNVAVANINVVRVTSAPSALKANNAPSGGAS